METTIFDNTRLEATAIVRSNGVIDHELSGALEQTIRNTLRAKKSFFCSTNPDSIGEEGTIEEKRILRLPVWSIEMSVSVSFHSIRHFRVAHGIEETLNAAAQWIRLTLERQA